MVLTRVVVLSTSENIEVERFVVSGPLPSIVFVSRTVITRKPYQSIYAAVILPGVAPSPLRYKQRY